jgi:hypothetical protein
VTAGKLGGDARLWGFVFSDGTLVRGHGIQGVGIVRTGVFAVQFAQDVSSCGYLALPLGFADPTNGPAAEIAATPGGFAPAAITVSMWDVDGNPRNASFYVAAVC